MRIVKTVRRTREETVDVLCNKCGKSCRYLVFKDKNGPYNDHGLIEAKVVGGFGSPVLEDGKTYTFSLCEHCLGKLFKTFKTKPEEERYL